MCGGLGLSILPFCFYSSEAALGGQQWPKGPLTFHECLIFYHLRPVLVSFFLPDSSDPPGWFSLLWLIRLLVQHGNVQTHSKYSLSRSMKYRKELLEDEPTWLAGGFVLASLGLVACPSLLMISSMGLQLIVGLHGCPTRPLHSHSHVKQILHR